MSHKKKRAHADLRGGDDEFLRSFAWRQLRMRVIKKRGARCECCGASPRDGATVIHVDHVKPRRDFPWLALDESNLQVLCHECNHGKGNWDTTDWRPEATAEPASGAPRDHGLHAAMRSQAAVNDVRSGEEPVLRDNAEAMRPRLVKEKRR